MKRLLLVVPGAYLGLFLLYPLLAILSKGLGADSGYNLEPLWDILTDRYYLGRIWFTTWQAALSTCLTLMVGLPVAFFFARYEFPGKSLVKATVTVPFVLPTIVVAIGFISLFGADGIINKALSLVFGVEETPVRMTNSLFVIVMAHAFYNYAVIVRIVSSFWANMDPALEETAKLLGAGPIRTFREVTLPILLPVIASASLLAFVFSFTSFGVVLILGGSEYATLEVVIFELTARLFRLPLASALAIIQIICTYLFLMLYTKFQYKMITSVNMKPRQMSIQKRMNPMDWVFLIGIGMLLITMLSPLIALVAKSILLFGVETVGQVGHLFSNETGSYFHLSPFRIVWNSLQFAFGTVIISVFVGTIATYALSGSPGRQKSKTDALLMLPLGISAVTLGFGYIIALSRPPIDLRGSWLILVIAHSLVAYPFVIRSVLPVLQGMPVNLREVAALLGAKPAKIFWLIDVPLIGPALIVGATFAFAVSMGEFGASAILVRPEFMTMPVAIFRYLGLPGASNIANALVMSVVLMSVVILGFVAIEKFRYKGVGGF